MIETQVSTESGSSAALPNSKKVYVSGKVHPALRVPLREITLHPTKDFNGRIEVNEPVRVYDCSGPWGDPDVKCDIEKGLPALRRQWILDRQDVEEYSGRAVRPEDNGYLSGKHADHA